MKTCASCKYFKFRNELRGTVNGECRYNPPSTDKEYFPTVRSTDWCGKFKPMGGFW